MNFTYFRKSIHSAKDAVAKVKEEAANRNLVVSGEFEVPGVGTVISVTDPSWFAQLAKIDKNLLPFLPSSIFVMELDGAVQVGSLEPTVIENIAHIHELHSMFAQMNKSVRSLVDDVSGGGARKIEKIRLYSTATCPYCKMEEAWLKEKNIAHELVMVDSNEKEAQRMVEKTGQMGVPVTEIAYDDGGEDFVVGFDKGRLSGMLGVAED